jgi:hypothetical protein
MAATILSSTFTLNSSSGTDPVNINIAPNFSTVDPTGSGSFETSPGIIQQILSVAGTTDYYILVRNIGMATGTKHGNLLVRSGTSQTIGLLKPNDFMFFPIKAGVGLEITYDSSVTTADWFYWTRSG